MADRKAKPQRPRRWTPMQAQGVIGRMVVPAMLLTMAAIYLEWLWLLVPAGVLWVIMLIILFLYWRCPACGKTLPKMGRVHECPGCGRKID